MVVGTGVLVHHAFVKGGYASAFAQCFLIVRAARSDLMLWWHAITYLLTPADSPYGTLTAVWSISMSTKMPRAPEIFKSTDPRHCVDTRLEPSGAAEDY